VPDIQRTAELVQEISAASREQDTGGEQINQALQQLEKVIQQNASASEEMAATTEELASQSEQLVNALAFFRTGQGSAAEDHFPSRAKAAAPHSFGVAHTDSSALGATKTEPRAGVSLKLKERDRDLDAVFERY
jgi:methyl-accepting chemotaxis protein